MDRLDAEVLWDDLDPDLTWDDVDPDLTWETWTHRPAGIHVEVDGTLRWWFQRTIRITDTVDDHSDLTVVVLDGPADWAATFGDLTWDEIDPDVRWESLPEGVNPRRGMPIRVLHAGEVAFDGWIDDVSSDLHDMDGAVRHTLRASDNVYLAEKRIVAAVWEDLTSGAIVREIVDDVLADEGITYTAESVDDGLPVRRWGVAYKDCASAIDELADQSNYVWYVSPDRVLHFHPRDRFEASWPVTVEDVDEASTSRGNDAYRNRQWMVGGKDTTDPITEQFVGDGERSTFTVGFPVRRMPTVKVNGTEETVGVRGIDDDSEDVDWYFSHESTEISQRRDADKLTSSDLIEVTYEGVFEFVAMQTADGARDDRVEVEGGSTSGLVEKVAQGDFRSRLEAFERGARKLEKYGMPSRSVTIETGRHGLRAGQLAPVHLPPLNLIDLEMLVTAVTVEEEGAESLRYTVTLVDGPNEESWRKLFRHLARPDTDQLLENISEDETVTLLFQYSKDWTFVENPNMLRRLTAGDGARAGDGYTAGFRTQDRVSFVEWTDLAGETVLGRSQLIDREGLDTDTVTSVAFLSAAQGSDGGVGELRWYGGHRASLEQGSGVLVATETVNEDKNEQMAWQVERVDRRDAGWDDDRAAALGGS